MIFHRHSPWKILTIRPRIPPAIFIFDSRDRLYISAVQKIINYPPEKLEIKISFSFTSLFTRCFHRNIDFSLRLITPLSLKLEHAAMTYYETRLANIFISSDF